MIADRSQQVPNNSYSPPPEYYVDVQYVCVDCGRAEVWKAEQQKWYYEVAKRSLYAIANRCLDCRGKPVQRGGLPPVHHVGTLMKRLFTAINQRLVEAGFRFDRKFTSSFPDRGSMEFSRLNERLVVSYRRPDGRDRLPAIAAESVHKFAGTQLIAYEEFASFADFDAEISKLASAIQKYLAPSPSEMTDGERAAGKASTKDHQATRISKDNMPEERMSDTELLRAAYAAFNSRDIAAALTTMSPSVKWPKAFKGGFASGHEEVRAYWTEQWSEINPHVEPKSFHQEPGGRVLVEVHQVVRDLLGNEIFDGHVGHRFTIEDGFITAMEVCDVPA